MAQMQIVIVNTSGINLIFPTKSCTPTKKATEGHDLHFSVEPSKDIVPYNPLDADKVVSEPIGRDAEGSEHFKVQYGELILQSVLDAEESNGGG